jgi:hypothetical protein
MADNTELNPGTAGDTVRLIDKAGVKTQVISLDVGGAGAESLLTTSNPMPATLYGKSADGIIRELSRDDISGNRSLFNELIIAERTPLIELNPAFGLTNRRDRFGGTGTGTVTNAAGEHILGTGTTPGSTAFLISQEFGRYYPGTSSEIGKGIRSPGNYTGTAFSEWGYFGTTDGFGWGRDATGVYLFYLRDSVKTKVYQADWDLDKLNGLGPSGSTLLETGGNIYRINFSWYGYGAIEWGIVKDNAAGRQTEIIVHRYRPTDENSIRNPNQPLTSTISNGDSTENLALYVGGRQYAIYGKYVPSIRRTPEHRLQRTAVGTAFVPLITFKRKAGFEWYPVKFHEVGITTTAPLLWALRLGGTLTGASFGAVSDVPITETALEVDVASSAITGGEKLESGLIAVSGSGGNVRGGFSATSFNLELPGLTTLTLCVRAITGTAIVDSVMGMEEEW